ncbi:MAG: peptidyl-prolyl cis-trans isomerase [Pseudomonadota bacterium]|nr:peptidyl-prolyl cis-trans isomerase [Pseudomonadota bacterium]
MLQFFRSFFSSTLGIALTLGMVGLIALAFAAGDVASSGGFGGVAGGDRAAMVGNQRISTSDLGKALTQNLDQARQQDPNLTMKAYVAGGGVDASLNQLIDRTAVAVFGEKHGIVAGKRLVDSELAKIPSLQGLDGKFSEATYRQMLAQRQLTDAEVRDSIAQSLIARETLRPAQYGAVIPAGVVMRYAQILKEHRSGIIALLPSAAFAPAAAPTDAQVASFYDNHRAAFIRPETRVLRYAIFGDDAVKSVAAPTDAEIAASYAANQAQYAASESRSITQLVAPTQAAAQAIAQQVATGKPLETVATSHGLSAAPLGLVTQSALADQTAPDVAAAAFAGKRGALIGPIKGPLGWHLLRIDAIEEKPGRSLAQARADIAAKLSADRHRAALADLTGRIDDRLGQGYALTDAAKDLGLPLQTTPPITADGKVPGAPTTTLPKELSPLLRTAFTMDRTNQPQLAEVEAGKTYVIYDVSQITPSAPAPLAQIKGDVTAAMVLEQGATNARLAAQKLLAEVRKGTDLAAGLNGLGVKLPPPSPVSISRDQLAAMGQKVPAPLSLLFAMAPNTIKLMAAPINEGWIVVQLKQIQSDPLTATDPLLASAATELGQMTGNEYAEEMGHAMRGEVGVTRNPVAIKAVAAQAVGN